MSATHEGYKWTETPVRFFGGWEGAVKRPECESDHSLPSKI